MRLLWAGVIIEVIGFIADNWYHANGGVDSGTVPPPHFIMLLGLVVVLFGAVRAWQETDRLTAEWLTLSGVILFGVVQFVGFVWDNALHLAGNEPAPMALPHIFNFYGAQNMMLFVILFSVVVLIRKARSGELVQSIRTTVR